MSATYDIACKDHKVMLWIGQKSIFGDSIYTGDKEVMAALHRFLWKHVGCNLVFDEDQRLGFDKYIEIEFEGEDEMNPDRDEP